MDNSSSPPDADTNFMFPLTLQKALRLTFVSRELFATGRNAVCVATLRNAHKFRLAQFCDWHYATSTFEIFPCPDQKNSNWIQLLIFIEGPLTKVLQPFQGTPEHTTSLVLIYATW